MASASLTCGICDLRNTTRTAIIWCQECEEGICESCQEHHSLSKLSRRHKVITIEDYSNIPKEALNISQTCDRHQQNFCIYCRKHHTPCCSKCVVESHAECHDIVNLEDVISNVKTSSAFIETEQSLDELIKNIRTISKEKKINIEELTNQKSEIKGEIHKMRARINQHLDKLQNNILEELSSIEHHESMKIQSFLESMNKLEKDVLVYQTNIVSIKEYATNLQTFITLSKLTESASETERTFEAMIVNLHNSVLSFDIGKTWTDLMDTKSFGQVYVIEKKKNIALSRRKNKEAQIILPSPPPSRSIDDIKIKKQLKIQTGSSYCFASCLLSGNKLVFANNTEVVNSSLKLFRNDKTCELESEIRLKTLTNAIVSIDNNTIAVSNNEGIHIIDIQSKEIKRSIKIDSGVYGMALRDNSLFFSCSKGIRMVRLSDGSVVDLVKEKMPTLCYIAVSDDRMYHTNRFAHTVTCYDRQGKLQWIFYDRILSCPYGIDIDPDGNVYVGGYSSKNVVVISPDGNRCKQLLSTSDGLVDPRSLHYNDITKQLLVTNFASDCAVLFNVK